ncbi:uncharacterized protein BDW43DRAFT_314845 [Aspergillus alliaceus]|uniref:uncharacterized protein n=1 Tax=Petromyces alliaceus TaxID=209559 RepID=UPI0012A70086|nr:uncharacterized protein BDW43DRAFT_314845 [Aspergillus alliaceus]KAB8229453.1 hypothetical protein BDW43DRAFT_314845 [Aspergillus alliaceus]
MAGLHVFLSLVLVLSAWANTWHFAFAQANSPRDITDMFHISFDPSIPGNCAAHGKDKLDQIDEDAFVLSEAGLQAVIDITRKNSKTRQEAGRLVTVLFQNPFEAVNNFFKEAVPILHDRSHKKPYLFCGDSWRIREVMSSQMRDAKGELMKDEEGSPYLIKDDKQMKKRQKAAKEDWGFQKLRSIYPYWCPGLKSYIFDKKYAKDPTEGPCSTGSSVSGYTVFELKTGIGAITLCDKAFNGDRLRTVNIKPFADSDLDNDEKPPKQSTTIEEVSPRATTLYHELFHLLWTKLMDPENGEEYDFKRMTSVVRRSVGKGEDKKRETFSKGQAMKNPHNYVYTAIGYDYTQNVNHVLKDHEGPGEDLVVPIEFYTGWATYHV